MDTFSIISNDVKMADIGLSTSIAMFFLSNRVSC